MKAIFRLALISLVIRVPLAAAEAELNILLEPPPVYVLETPYDSRVDSLPSLGAKVRPKIGDIGAGSSVARLSSPAMKAELGRLNERFQQITEALYEQRFYGHADEHELKRWLAGKDELTPDAEKVIRDSARTNCHFDSPRGESPADAARTLEIIKSLGQAVVPKGAGRKVLTDLMRDLRDMQLGPYREARIRENLMDICIAALKGSRLSTTHLSERLVPLVLVDPNRQQYLEINSEAFRHGPLAGLRATQVTLRRLSTFEPKVIQQFIDYWEMSQVLDVYTKQDRTWFNKASPIAIGGAQAVLADLKAAKKNADGVRAFWKSQDNLHAMASSMARPFFDSSPPFHPTAYTWDVKGCDSDGLSRYPSTCFGAVERLQAKWDREYNQQKMKNEDEIGAELSKKVPNAPKIVILYYARMINELKYKSGPLPAESTGELYLADFLEFIRSTQLVRVDGSITPMFEEDDASVPVSSLAPTQGSHDVVYRPLRLFRAEVPLQLDSPALRDNLPVNEFADAFDAQENAQAAGITSAMSRYRPPSFYRVMEEIRTARAGRVQLDQDQAALASAFRRERDQLLVALSQMEEQFAEGEAVPPIAGTIVRLHVANGALIRSGSPIVSLSPLLNYSATFCQEKVGTTRIQSGLLLETRLAGFELNADAANAIKGVESAWNSQIAPALHALTMQVSFEEARTARCGNLQGGWRLTLRPHQRQPLIYVRASVEGRDSVIQVLDRLGWRYFVDGDEFTISVDSPFVDTTQKVRLAVDNG
jgi:hypothetical protein